MLKSVAYIATKDHVNVRGQVSHLSPCQWPRDMLQLGTGRSEWAELLPDAMVISGPGLQLGAMSRFMTLLQLRSVLMCKVPVTIKGHMDA